MYYIAIKTKGEGIEKDNTRHPMNCRQPLLTYRFIQKKKCYKHYSVADFNKFER